MRNETFTQVALIAGLRWRLFRNSLHTTRAKLELAGQIFISILAAVVAVGGGLALFALGFLLANTRHHPILHGLLWGIFLAWLILPLIVAAGTTSIDFRELLRFPLRFSSYLLLSLAYSLFDPVALAALFWLVCLFAGIVSARPDVVHLIAPAFLGLAIVSLFLSRGFMTVIERLFRRRRGREIFFTIFVLAMLSVQLVVIAAEDYLDSAWEYVEANPGLLLIFPPSLAYAALESALVRSVEAPLAVTAVLFLYAALLYRAHRRRVLAQYRGEDLSVGAAVSTAPATPIAVGWHLPPLPGTIAALVEREFRYASRNGFTLMNLAIPIFLPAIFGAVAMGGEKLPGLLSRDTGATFFGLVAYTQMVTSQLVFNQFAFEGHGIQFLFLAPVRFREVIAAKNLAYAAAVLLDVVLIWVVMATFGQAPGAMATLTVLAALPFLLLAQMAVGNLLSLYFPRRFDFGKFKQRQSGTSVLLGMLQQMVALAIAGGIYALGRWLNVLWAAALLYLVLGAAMWMIYSLLLGHYDSIALRRRESLTAELCHD
jgi:ABC-2 type transport system permease protein